MKKILILIGGIINILIAAMHMTLSQAGNWTETLSSLSLDNRATMYTLNIHVALACLIFGYVSLFHRKELLTSSLGRSVTAGIGLFWILRAVNQVIFWGSEAPDTPFWVIFCLAVSLMYIVPTFGKRSVQPIPVAS